MATPRPRTWSCSGAYVQMVKPVALESIEKSMEEAIPKRNHSFIPLNVACLRKGAEMAAG